MFLKNCWHVAALDHELIDSRLLSRTLLGERVRVARARADFYRLAHLRQLHRTYFAA